ncbi:hydroxylase [Streptomyces sp. WAC 05977]|nr:hydroxylase [Streptomyces sp. WAC 05977]
MANDVLENLEGLRLQLCAQAAEAEELGSLPGNTADILRKTGLVRMLQPRRHGGLETDPWDFFDAVILAAESCSATGWVAGVLGSHPWQMALMPESVQHDVWAADPDTWIASPFSPFGKARRVEGGYLLSGRWAFSSGTDHCEWAWLGATVVDDEGNRVGADGTLHMLLPRSDYTIIDGSWNAVGLRGSGSKDVTVTDAFVPLERVIAEQKVVSGAAAREAGRSENLFRMPWSAIFPNAITASIIGMCRGALAASFDYQRDRVDEAGRLVREDKFLLAQLSECYSEVESARAQLTANVRRMWDIVDSGKEVPFEVRAAARCDQVRGSRRAVEALDRLYSHSGGNALRSDRPMQRFWRDAHAGLNHAINVYSGPYQAYALTRMGAVVPPNLRNDI